MALSLQQVQKQTHKLVMTQQMQQSIQLLQMSSLDLEQLADQEMIQNPFLEIAEDSEVEEESTRESPEEAPTDTSDARPEASAGDGAGDSQPAAPESETPIGEGEHFSNVDVNWDEYYDDSECRTYTPREAPGEEPDFEAFVAVRESLYHRLKWQLHVALLDKHDLEIGEYIIGNIDDDGYLRVSVEELAVDLDRDSADVERVLRLIQTFEPVGVGARNLSECLRIQLENGGVKDALVYEIVSNHLGNLQRKNLKDIARELKIDEARVREIFHLISHLEPKPGRATSADEVKYIQPDVVVKKVDDEYMIFLNEGRTSGLRISRYYRDMLQSKDTFAGKEREFAQEKFKAAVWLIRNIEKRKSTILKVTEAIMDFQKDFLEKGTSGLRPLTLKEIAEVVGMHESTVARVTTAKYVETPRGIFELKYFFSPGLGTSSGEEASSTSIKEILGQLIAAESPRKPLSDQKLSELIQQRGVSIARRTVAKYREQLQILPAKLRKQIA
jgi:RNA polymerase sigma-54 factor